MFVFFKFFFFLDFLFCYISETNLRLFTVFEANLGLSRSLTTSGIVLSVTLVNGFWPWINVEKISVLDVVGILDYVSVFGSKIL